MKIHQITTLIMILSLPGCVSTYEGAKAGEPSAVLKFSESVKGMKYPAGVTAGQSHWIYADTTCKNSNKKMAALFASSTSFSKTHDWKNDTEEVFNVGTAKPIIIESKFRYSADSAGYGPSGAVVTTSKQECIRFTEFLPEEGKSYDVVFLQKPDAECDVQIVDAKSKEPVKKFKSGKANICKE